MLTFLETHVTFTPETETWEIVVDAQNLEQMIQNKSVSDKTLFKALIKRLADKTDAAGNIIPISDKEIAENEHLFDLVRIHRPQVYERIRKLVIDLFSGC